MLRIASSSVVVALALVLPAAAGAALDPLRLTFEKPTQVSQGAAYQAAEPSIRVDAASLTQRTWIAAPSGIGVEHALAAGVRPKPATSSGTRTTTAYSWNFVTGPEGVGSPTIIGGGDSDIATGFGSEVYGTGLTLANITLAASCSEGASGTFTFNPISVLSPADDRQWIDTYEDSPAPPGAPALVLTYGNIGAGEILFNQVLSPGCAPPVGAPGLDASMLDCAARARLLPVAREPRGRREVRRRLRDVQHAGRSGQRRHHRHAHQRRRLASRHAGGRHAVRRRLTSAGHLRLVHGRRRGPRRATSTSSGASGIRRRRRRRPCSPSAATAG